MGRKGINSAVERSLSVCLSEGSLRRIKEEKKSKEVVRFIKRFEFLVLISL